MIEPVSVAELGNPVPLGQVSAWVEELCGRYKNDDWSDHFSERRGLTNKLQGELVPLAILCKRLAPDRPTSQLRYHYGSEQSFDAEILSANGSIEEVLEVTLACDGHRDAIAAEALKRYGFAPLWTPLSHAGTRRSRMLPKPQFRVMKADQIVADGLTLIQHAVRAKVTSNKYDGINLVVAFDDFRLRNSFDFERVRRELEAIDSTFGIIYFVGLCGTFYYRRQTEA